MSRRWAAIGAVIVLAAGAVAAIALSRPSHANNADVARLLAPTDPVIDLPPTKVPFEYLPCRQVQHFSIMRADSAHVTGGVATIRGHVIDVICHHGKPIYRPVTQTVSFDLAPHAVVLRRLPHHARRLPIHALPSYLSNPDSFAGSAETYLYRFFGPQTSVEKMIELGPT